MKHMSDCQMHLSQDPLSKLEKFPTVDSLEINTPRRAISFSSEVGHF